MSKKQENKTTKSIQFDSQYNERVIEPFLKDRRTSFSFYARELVIKDIAEKAKNNEK